MDTKAPSYKRDSAWYEAREAEQEVTERWRNQLEGWCAKHPGCCPMCGRPESVHKELGDCASFAEEASVGAQGFDDGYRGRICANPYPLHSPIAANLWDVYEEGYREGAGLQNDD